MVELLRYQIEHAAWANQRALAAALQLTPDELEHDFKTSETCVRGTLVHMYRAERVWHRRLDGKPVQFREDGDHTMAALSQNWPPVSEMWLQFGRSSTDETVQTQLTYTDLKNNIWTQPLWKIILHVVNHATHHRGQAMGFIRALGHTPPNTDSITFARESA